MYFTQQLTYIDMNPEFDGFRLYKEISSRLNMDWWCGP